MNNVGYPALFMNIKRYFFEHELSQITHELFVNDYIHEKFKSSAAFTHRRMLVEKSVNVNT